MRRGDVYFARLRPAEGSEQAGARPVIIVSRDSINRNLSTVVVVPCTTYRPGRRLHASQIVLRASDGGLDVDSVAMCEQITVLTKTRLLRRLGVISPSAMSELENALLSTLSLPRQL